MIYLEDFKFWYKGKRINKPHDGVTLLDACESLLICPLAATFQYGYTTSRDSSGKVAVYKLGMDGVRKELPNSDSVLLSAMKRASCIKMIDKAFTVRSHNVGINIRLEFENDLKVNMLLGDVYFGDKTCSIIALPTTGGISFWMPDTAEFSRFWDTYKESVFEFLDRIGLLEELKIKMVVDSL